MGYTVIKLRDTEHINKREQPVHHSKVTRQSNRAERIKSIGRWAGRKNDRPAGGRTADGCVQDSSARSIYIFLIEFPKNILNGHIYVRLLLYNADAIKKQVSLAYTEKEVHTEWKRKGI